MPAFSNTRAVLCASVVERIAERQREGGERVSPKVSMIVDASEGGCVQGPVSDSKIRGGGGGEGGLGTQRVLKERLQNDGEG
jgi:hypothetical protein